MDSSQRSDGEAVESKPNVSMTPKSVTIANPEASSSILDLGEPALGTAGSRSRRASGARRLTGRPSKSSFEHLPKLSSLSLSDGFTETESTGSSHGEHHIHAHSRLHGAVTTWLKDERSKWQTRTASHEKSYAQVAFESLEKILASHPIVKHQRPVFPGPKRGSSRKLKQLSLGAHTSDTEYSGDDPVVPTTDETLDNSQMVGLSGVKEAEALLEFKNEIIKLAHTLRLKGWRRVGLDAGNEIEVSRLSGALTNAVYVVVPPKMIDKTPSTGSEHSGHPKRSPLKLLLRVYGPQAGHLIDREKELEILKRLARQRIGPRLLGTFLNGRFEQFFNAKTLTPDDVRDPETSKQIAKRMRELHDGIDLTKEERSAGPFVWQNWDKWVKRCEEVITWLVEEILDGSSSGTANTEPWRNRGLVCGVPWKQFSEAVYNYRQWLKEKYGGGQGLRSSLVFAHNDTQYGNILRIEPSGESPLLLPSNEHKQLVVIDFEYANANTPGLEFANHFTEWCYNYHADDAWACHTERYPHPREQARFIKAYVLHDRKYHAPPTTSGPEVSSTSLATFMLDARVPPNYSYADEEGAREEAIKKQTDDLIHEARLWRMANSAQWVAWGIVQAKVAGMEEALALRRRSHQAKENPTESKPSSTAENDTPSNATADADTESFSRPPHEHETDDKGQGNGNGNGTDNEEEEEFDYLAYAQDRAMFFWADLLEFGLVADNDLPADVRRRVLEKRLQY